MSKTASAATVFNAARKATPAPTGREDRSVPLSSVSTLWAEVFNERQDRKGAALAPVEDLAAMLEKYGVDAVRAEMLALAKSLTSAAKNLTAEDVRVLGNVAGSQVTLSVPGLVTGHAVDGARTGKGDDRSSGSASVRFTPAPGGSIGTVLRDLRVSPRAVKVEKPAQD